jgi:glycosyltransferase involved in cell wall biosynthesis
VLQEEHLVDTKRVQLETLVDQLIVVGDDLEVLPDGASRKATYGVRACWPETVSIVQRIATTIDILAVIAEYVYMTPCFDSLRENVLKLTHTIDMHSRIASEIRAHGVDTQAREMPATEERMALMRGDIIIALQEHEAKLFKKLVPERETIVVSYGLEPLLTEHETNPITGRVLMVGSQNPLNSHGLELFCRHVWPKVLVQVPDAELRLVGRIGEHLPEGVPNVTIVGVVDDLSQEYAEASIVINPVDFGTGLKIKTVEALCYGKALVCTPTGTEGIPFTDTPPCLIADDWPVFADGVISLLSDTERRLTLEKRASAFARRTFSTDVIYRELKHVLQDHSNQLS